MVRSSPFQRNIGAHPRIGWHRWASEDPRNSGHWEHSGHSEHREHSEDSGPREPSGRRLVGGGRKVGESREPSDHRLVSGGRPAAAYRLVILTVLSAAFLAACGGG